MQCLEWERCLVEMMAWLCELRAPVPPGLAMCEETKTCSDGSSKSYWVPLFGQLIGIINLPLLGCDYLESYGHSVSKADWK